MLFSVLQGGRYRVLHFLRYAAHKIPLVLRNEMSSHVNVEERQLGLVKQPEHQERWACTNHSIERRCSLCIYDALSGSFRERDSLFIVG